MDRSIKNILRFAMENSDNTITSTIDPERAEFLRNALENSSVDLTKQLKDDIAILLRLKDTPDVLDSDALNVLEDILSLTEDIDLANDFYKMGGMKLLVWLLFDGPVFLKSGAYRLLAYTTQNNPYAQKICLEENLLQRIVPMVLGEQDLGRLKHLLSAISCLARGSEDGARAFYNSNGFHVVVNKMRQLLLDPELSNFSDLPGVLTKSSFVLFCLVQELLTLFTDETKYSLTDDLVFVTTHCPKAEEHLLACLVLMLTGNPSITAAIDSENVSEIIKPHYSPPLSPESQSLLVKWLKSEDYKCGATNDPANAELLSYIGALRQILNV